MNGSDENPQTRFQAHLVQLARGSFLFTRLILDLIQRASITIKSASFKVGVGGKRNFPLMCVC